MDCRYALNNLDLSIPQNALDNYNVSPTIRPPAVSPVAESTADI